MTHSNTTQTPTAGVKSRAADFRAAADLLDRFPTLAAEDVSHYGNHGLHVRLYKYNDNPKERMLAIRREIGGSWEKNFTSYGDFELETVVDGISITLKTDREEVCELVTVGEKTVTELVAPEGVEMVEVTKTVPVTEWRCSPVLEDSAA